MTIFLSFLAIPIGIIVFFAILFLIGIFANFPAETLGVLLLILIGYSIGTWILGIESVLF